MVDGGRFAHQVTLGCGLSVQTSPLGPPMHFRGRDRTSVDAKGRTSVPARVREQLEDEYPAKQARHLVVVPWFDGNLRVYPLVVWEQKQAEFEARFNAEDVFAIDEVDSDLRRFLYGMAQDLTIDPQGRVLLSQELREHAGMDRDVLWVAMGAMLEAWDPARFQARFEGARATSLRSSLQSRLRPENES